MAQITLDRVMNPFLMDPRYKYAPITYTENVQLLADVTKTVQVDFRASGTPTNNFCEMPSKVILMSNSVFNVNYLGLDQYNNSFYPNDFIIEITKERDNSFSARATAYLLHTTSASASAFNNAGMVTIFHTNVQDEDKVFGYERRSGGNVSIQFGSKAFVTSSIADAYTEVKSADIGNFRFDTLSAYFDVYSTKDTYTNISLSCIVY